MTAWIWAVLGFVAGAGVGWLAMLILARRSEPQQQLRRLRTELDQLQGQVAQHFAHSATLITRLRGDVEQLYSHLERGAHELTAEDAVQRRLRALETPGERPALPEVGTAGPLAGPPDGPREA